MAVPVAVVAFASSGVPLLAAAAGLPAAPPVKVNKDGGGAGVVKEARDRVVGEPGTDSAVLLRAGLPDIALAIVKLNNQVKVRETFPAPHTNIK